MKIDDAQELHKEMRQGLSACVSTMRDMFLAAQKDPGKVARFLQAVEFHQKILGKMVELENMDEEFKFLISPPEIAEFIS